MAMRKHDMDSVAEALLGLGLSPDEVSDFALEACAQLMTNDNPFKGVEGNTADVMSAYYLGIETAALCLQTVIGHRIVDLEGAAEG